MTRRTACSRSFPPASKPELEREVMKSLVFWMLTALLALALAAEAGDAGKPNERIGCLVSEIVGEPISVEITKVQTAESPPECREFKIDERASTGILQES